MNTKARGSIGEQIAVNYLKSNGYAILERNSRVGGVEVDIIAKQDGVFVFIEVKCRESTDFGYPSEAVLKRQCNRYVYAAKCYIAAHKITNKDFRFDVIEVLNGEVNHIVAAFGE